MKIRTFLVFLLIFIAMMLLPKDSLAANKIGTHNDEGTIYELYDDNTARVIEIAIGTVDKNFGNVRTEINSGVVGTDGNEYKVTSISKDALENITQTQDLYLNGQVAPVLETNNPEEFFKYIKNIYVRPEHSTSETQYDAKGYTEENGWIKEKLKNYIVTEQPKKETVVTAGNIADTDKLKVDLVVVAGGPYYKIARWYYCDENGNILDKNGNIMDETDIKTDEDDPNVEPNYIAKYIGKDQEFQIPTDLAYDNKNNSSKVYYFRAIVGHIDNIFEYSDVAKVTVNPGTYKASFHYEDAYLVEEELVAPVILPVNNARMLSDTELSKIPTAKQLEEYRKGAELIGWTTFKRTDYNWDEKVTIIKLEDLANIVLEKNTDFYPVWQTKINFDANGGKFEDGSTVFSTYLINNYDFEDDYQEPKMQGYEFVDYFSQKTGGDEYWWYMEENDIEEEITFYAQWTKDYTYTFITGEKQTFTLKSIDKYTFKIDGDYSLFKKLTIDKLNLKKDVDYTVDKGSTVIVFTDEGLEKLKTLQVGTYDVVVEYNNDKSVTGQLIIAESNLTDEDNKDDNTGIGDVGTENADKPNADDPDKDNTEKENINTDNKDTNKPIGNNPQTGDDIVLFTGILAISVMGIIITKRIRKNKHNN